ncbi:MAG: PAS domain-containing protein [Desulfamplus sp.]|nr:PAS domain-containing protein [Desulfamplus sp.]
MNAQTLKNQETQYKELVEALNVGVFRATCSTDEIIFLTINPAVAHIFGYDSIDEFMQTSMRELYQDPQHIQDFIEHIRYNGQCKSLEFAMIKKEGTPIWVSCNATVQYEQCDQAQLSCTSENKGAGTASDPENISSGVVLKIKWIDGVLEDITERKEEANKLKRLNEAYERFVPHGFLKTLGKKSIEEVQLNDRIQEKMTILFSDIRLFSNLSETMTPEENFKFINSYLSHMGPFVRKHHGFIDKFIGDSIMAIFDRDADDAISCAIAMIRELRHYNEGRKRAGYRPIDIGIGINTGILMLGTVGDADHMEGTVISDAVNAASRLEQLTKKYNTSLLISEHTLHSLKKPSDFAIRFVDRVLVKGRTEPIAIYEVFNADPPAIFESKMSNKSLFETAMYHYRYQDMEYARNIIEALLKRAPEDPLAIIYQSIVDNKDEQFFSPWHNRKEFELKKELICDIPVIDNGHVEMFRLIYLLIEIIKQNLNKMTIIEVLIELHKTSTLHFQSEERMMRQAAYPELDQHIMLHKDFLRNSEFVLDMASGTSSISKADALHLLLRIETLFVEWLAKHEIVADKHFISSMMGLR